MEDKLTAIYALRDAAAVHAKIEMAVGENPTADDRDRLLDARIDLEQKTQQAVESCVHCGRLHVDENECAPDEGGSVIAVDFIRRERTMLDSEETGPETAL